MIRRMLRVAGIDTHVGWTLLARLFSMVAGFLAIIPISLALTPVEQGYYYTFFSIVALQVLFELGFTQVLVQVTSHAFADREGHGDDAAFLASAGGRKLRFVARLARRWYAIAAALFFTSVAGGGTWYFAQFGELARTDWLAPWIVVVAGTAGMLYLGPRLAFVEGAGHPGLVAPHSRQQSAIGYALLVALLLAGAGLWAATAIPVVNVLTTLWWLRRDRPVPDFFGIGAGAAIEADPGWRGELLSLQWRVALSFIGGYFASLVFMPLLFAAQGAVVAGQWGMTFAAMTAIQTLGFSWLSARTPRFGAQIARGERADLDREFKGALLRSTAFTAAAVTGFLVAVALASRLGFAIDDRLLPPGAALALAAAAVLNTVIFGLATYMRAHKEEPLVASSIVIGGTTVVLAWIAARHGALATALVLLGVTALVNLPWRILIYRRYRRRGALPAGDDRNRTKGLC